MPACTAATPTPCLSPLGVGVEAKEFGTVHDVADPPPGGRAAPFPQVEVRAAFAGALRFSDAMYEVECVEQRWREGHGPKDAASSFLQAFKDQGAVDEINATHRDVFTMSRPRRPRRNHALHRPLRLFSNEQK